MPALDDDREERLAQELAKGATQAVAWTNAGYAAKNSGVASSACNRLLKNKPYINERVGELKAIARTEKFDGEFTADVATLTRMLLEDREFATDARSPSARISATSALMKLHGLGSETVRNPDVVDTLSLFLSTLAAQPRLGK